MGKKHYSQSIKDEAVLFYELGHSFAETQAKYGMAESTFFTWKQKFDKAHPVHAAITTNRATSHKSKRHLEKLALELEVLRQCPCGSKTSIDEKVAAVNALCGRYSIHVLCDALSLPRGTYYNRKRRAGQRTSYEINDEKLKPLIRQIFHDSKNRFGRKPIHHKLAELGYKVSEKRIVRLMKEMGLSVAKPRYKAEHQKSLPRAYFRNLLARQFDQPQPNLIWVSDITYIKVLDQYYYICVVLDLFSRRILSYSISDSINTALTLAAFDDAFQSRNPPQDLMFHSDQGAQYTSYIFRAHLKELHIKQSFSTPGTPYDNSVCESFFHTLKKEALYHHLYGTPQELQAVLDEYMSKIFSAMCRLFFCRFLLGCTSDALSARRASQTKRSLPLRTTAVMGAVMIPSSSKIADRSGRYSVRIASCKATLEVEITTGSFIRSGRCICQRIQATR